MRFVCRKNASVQRTDYSDFIAKWIIDIKASEEDGLQDFTVGRISAVELMLSEAEERGFDPADVADSDSAELEGAYAMLCDWEGNFREGDFDYPGCLVLIEAFALHPDFSEWRIHIMERFCQLFPCESVVMIGCWVPAFSDTEYSAMAFEQDDHNVAPTRGLVDIDRSSAYMIRNNTLAMDSENRTDPELVGATAEHEEWLEKQVNWKDFDCDE